MIKVTLGEVKTQEEKPFPKLMIRKDQNLIILFEINKCDGIVINGGSSPYPIGFLVRNLGLNWFTDYNEPITVQNA